MFLKLGSSRSPQKSHQHVLEKSWGIYGEIVKQAVFFSTQTVRIMSATEHNEPGMVLWPGDQRAWHDSAVWLISPSSPPKKAKTPWPCCLVETIDLCYLSDHAEANLREKVARAKPVFVDRLTMVWAALTRLVLIYLYRQSPCRVLSFPWELITGNVGESLGSDVFHCSTSGWFRRVCIMYIQSKPGILGCNGSRPSSLWWSCGNVPILMFYPGEILQHKTFVGK